MKKLKVGILGLGDISDVYINNLKKYDIVEVAACAARDLEKAKEKANQHKIEKAYATANDLFADPEIDIILNLTIPAAHGALNLMALNAGKHVYSEKPLAATFQEGKKILDSAKEKGLCVGCAPDTFLGGRLQTCRKIIDEGGIGEIVAASAFVLHHGVEWFHPNPDFFYKSGAGPLLDIGPYYMTALLSLIGPVKRCCAMASKSFDKRRIESEPRRGEFIDVEVDTHLTGSLEFVNGAIATIVTSFDVWDSDLPRIEIYGTKGTLCIPDRDPLDGPNLFGGEVFLMTEERSRWKYLPRTDSGSAWEKVPIRHLFNSTSHKENSRGIGLVDMAYAIRNGRKARADGEMALHSLEAMEGLLKSAREGRFYSLESTFDRPEPLSLDFPESEGE